MKILTPKGSSQRLVEMFQKVNKIQFKEGFALENDSNNLLNNAYDKLKNNQIKITNTQTQVNGEKTFIELNCNDENNSKITFNFQALSNESEQDGVFSVGDTQLIGFKFEPTDGSQGVEMDQNSLKNFNQQHSGELYDIIDKYIDVESETTDELYEEAIKKIDSYPFGGGSSRIQTGKSYADEKPTNPKLRVKAPELDKYIDENDEIDTNTDETDDNADIEQLAKDKEENGEELVGGLGDNESPLNFDKDQILKGLEVEMEHTDDPMVALEITQDHLRENPKYYDYLNKMEKEMDNDSESNQDDPMTDVLLGYKPKNVGDEI